MSLLYFEKHFLNQPAKYVIRDLLSYRFEAPEDLLIHQLFGGVNDCEQHIISVT